MQGFPQTYIANYLMWSIFLLRAFIENWCNLSELLDNPRRNVWYLNPFIIIPCNHYILFTLCDGLASIKVFGLQSLRCFFENVRPPILKILKPFPTTWSTFFVLCSQMVEYLHDWQNVTRQIFLIKSARAFQIEIRSYHGTIILTWTIVTE